MAAVEFLGAANMSGAAFMRLDKLKENGIWLKAARHNKRTIQAELGASGHIDDGMASIDDLLNRLGLELGGIFPSLHLHGSNSVLTSLFVY